MAKGSSDVDKLILMLEKEVTCPICHEKYGDLPKILPCLHYYCKECLRNLVKRKDISKPFHCPGCRRETTLPEEGVEGLKSAFFISRFQSTLTDLQLHSHTEGEQSEQCPNHKEKMNVFCFDCNHIICQDCLKVDHKDHKFHFSKIAADEALKELEKELDSLKRVSHELFQAAKVVQATQEGVESQGVGVAHTINTSFDELITKVEQHRQCLLLASKKLVGENVEKLRIQEENLTLACAEALSLICSTERAVSQLSDNDFLCLKNKYNGAGSAKNRTMPQAKQRHQTSTMEQVVQKTEQCHKQSKDIKPVQEADLGVEVCTNDIKSILQTKSKLIQISLSACTVDGEGLNNVEIGEVGQVIVTTRKDGRVSGELKSLYDNSVNNCTTHLLGPGKHLVQYTPTVCGRHELTVFVDGRHIVGSPFPVLVSIHPSQLGKPIIVWNELKQPSGIASTSRGELIASKQRGDVITCFSDGVNNRNMRNLCSYRTIMWLDLLWMTRFFYITLSNSPSLYKLARNGKIAAHVRARECKGHLVVTVVDDKVMVCPHPTEGTIVVYSIELCSLLYVEN